MRTDRIEVIDPFMSLLTDSKGVYDALNNELPQDDKKSAVEMPIIEELLDRLMGRCRWIPHNFNPADGLTKLQGAHLQPLMDLLKTGFISKRKRPSLKNGPQLKKLPDTLLDTNSQVEQRNPKNTLQLV